jgi:hypothetical protein
MRGALGVGARVGAIGVAAAVLLGLAACDGDTLRIAFQISDGPAQACPSAAAPAAPTCADVPMLCDAVLNIRIVRPASPEETYLPLCEIIPRATERNLCSIEQINLPARQLPKETLEVQVMIWPRAAVKEDPATGELDCREIYGQPVSVGFGVDGFPEEISPSPAVGGRAYYHPGDEQTVVTLGCADLAAVNRPSCAGQIELRAGVGALDAPLGSVSSVSAADLMVSVGEPRYDINLDAHEWSTIKVLDLEPTAPGQAPLWSAGVDALASEGTLCVDVIGLRGMNTAALRCARIDPSARMFDLSGIWVPTSRLGQILAGLGLLTVPPRGLTVGVLLDGQGLAAAGYQIATSPSSAVQYLSEAGEVLPGATATASSGLFVSLDAPYDADFLALQGGIERARGVGGRVNGQVTVVVLRLGS